MSLKTLHSTLRAAARERLLATVDVDVTPGVAITASGGVYTRASGSWVSDGFCVGQEITVSGITGAAGVGLVAEVSALALTTTLTGAGSGSGGRFLVALPSGRAWEGEVYFPTGVPFVTEVFQPISSRGRGIGGGGPIEHRLNAIYSLTYPQHQGTLAIESMAGALMAQFARGTLLSRSGVGARVQDVQRSQLLPDGEWIGVAVTVELLAWSD